MKAGKRVTPKGWPSKFNYEKGPKILTKTKKGK